MFYNMENFLLPHDETNTTRFKLISIVHQNIKSIISAFSRVFDDFLQYLPKTFHKFSSTIYLSLKTMYLEESVVQLST